MTRLARTSEFAGAVVVITGAARGFGRTLALMFADRGASVVISDLRHDAGSDRFYAMSSSDDLRRVEAEVLDRGAECLALPCDVTRSADCDQMATATLERFGKVDVVVANAGVWSLARAWEFTEVEWDITLRVCLTGAWLSTRAFVPSMIARRRGTILFVSSIAGLRAYPKYAAYIAAKHGVIGLMKAMAIELGEYDINVNAVCPTQMGKPQPGGQADPVWEEFVGHPNPTVDEFEAAAASENLLSSRGIPGFAEVGEAVVWLASGSASLITGHALPIDAGWVAKRGG